MSEESSSLREDIRELRRTLAETKEQVHSLRVALVEIRTERRLFNSAWSGLWGLVAGAAAGMIARFFEAR